MDARSWLSAAIESLEGATEILITCSEIEDRVEREGARGGLGRLLFGDDRISFSEWRDYRATLESGLDQYTAEIEQIERDFRDLVENAMQAFGLADSKLEDDADEGEMCPDCGKTRCHCDDDDW